MTTRYYIDVPGNLYRTVGGDVWMHSRYLAREWAPLLVPLRHAQGLREISRLRAVVTVAWRRATQ